MCTLSFVPLKNGYVLTSNRDENLSRPHKILDKSLFKGKIDLYGHVDNSIGGGTSIATDKKGRSVCLLNGAYQKHKSQSSYKRNRGQLVLNAFEYSDFKYFTEKIFLKNIEPFTMLLAAPKQLQILVWDGYKKIDVRLSMAVPYLWSSSTQYSKEEHILKEDYFLQNIRLAKNSPNEVLEIHGKNEQTPLRINHNKLRTTSITQIVHHKGKSTIAYFIKDETDKTHEVTNRTPLICY